METVSFETAIKLHASGFLPIDFYTEQLWYCRKGAYGKPTNIAELRLLCPLGASIIIAFDHIGSIGKPIPIIPQYKKMKPIWEVYQSEDLYFAPTAPDILKELGKDYNLSFFEGLFYCVYDNLMGKAYSHENPAEACALAYLDK